MFNAFCSTTLSNTHVKHFLFTKHTTFKYIGRKQRFDLSTAGRCCCRISVRFLLRNMLSILIVSSMMNALTSTLPYFTLLSHFFHLRRSTALEEAHNHLHGHLELQRKGRANKKFSPTFMSQVPHVAGKGKRPWKTSTRYLQPTHV